MARTKTRPDTAPSAAHAATDPAPAPATAPVPDSPAAAVHAALAANPGGTVADIAGAVGTGKPAARDALLAMEKDGTATRIKGSRPGIPDTWTLAEPGPDSACPAADPQGEQPGQHDDGRDGSLYGVAEGKTAHGAGQDSTAETYDPAPEDGDDAEANTSATPGPEKELPESHDKARAGDRMDAATGEQGDGEAPDSGGPREPDDSDDPPKEDATQTDDDGEASDAPDPALVTDLTERTTQIKAAADAATRALAGSGDLRATLAGLDEIYEQAAQARRALKAAIGGKKAPAARPGGLRDTVLAHLDAHPDAEFTPHEIHKVLNHSSGAIANALDTLVKLGEAELATDKPRRFRRAARPATRPDDAGNAEDSAELAGAA